MACRPNRREEGGGRVGPVALAILEDKQSDLPFVKYVKSILSNVASVFSKSGKHKGELVEIQKVKKRAENPQISIKWRGCLVDNVVREYGRTMLHRWSCPKEFSSPKSAPSEKQVADLVDSTDVHIFKVLETQNFIGSRSGAFVM